MPRLGNNGGLMGLRRVPSTGSASGVWDSDEQSLAKRAGIWPLTNPPTTARYWRLSNFGDEPAGDNYLDLAEIELFNQNTVLNSTYYGTLTCTSNITWDINGYDVQLIDGTITPYWRNLKGNWSAIRSTSIIGFDFGTAVSVTHIKVYSLYQNNPPRAPQSFDVSSSSDNAVWTVLNTISLGSSFTDLGGGVYASDKTSILPAIL